MKTQIIVTSSSHMPRFCAGESFTGAKGFDLAHFSAEQLHNLLADRMLTVVVGRVLTAADVDGFCAAAAEAAEYAVDKSLVPHDVEIHSSLPAGVIMTDTAEAATAAGETELVSGLDVYPAGSKAAVLPAPGSVLVDPETAGGTVNAGPRMPPVVAAVTRGKAHKRG